MAIKASSSTPAQQRAALQRPAHDPPTRPDGLCYVCSAARGPVAVKHDDPFCSASCARSYHDCPLPVDQSPKEAT